MRRGASGPTPEAPLLPHQPDRARPTPMPKFVASLSQKMCCCASTEPPVGPNALTRLCGALALSAAVAQPQFDELLLVDEVVADVQRAERLVVSG